MSIWAYIDIRIDINMLKKGEKMKSKRVLLGMLVIILAFGMTVVGCDNGTTSGGSGVLDGTFINQTNNSYKIVIKGSSWTSSIDNENWGKGTFTLSGNNISGRSTQAWDNNAWVPYTADTFSATMVEGGDSFTITAIVPWEEDFLGTYLRQ